MQQGYNHIADYYDLVHGSRKQTVAYIKNVIKTFHPKAKTVLSLACGTGTIAKALSKRYQVTGLDIAADMIAVAQKKAKNIQFHVGDMTKLDLNERFDVITCLYASLNHVLDFDDWAQFFQRVAKHLNPGGIFIFDVITETGMYNMVLNSPLIIERGKHLSVGEIRMADNGQSTLWTARGFDRRGKEQRQVYETTVEQIAFASERIYDALSACFTEVLVEDPEQEEVSEQSELLYFLARNG